MNEDDMKEPIAHFTIDEDPIITPTVPPKRVIPKFGKPPILQNLENAAPLPESQQQTVEDERNVEPAAPSAPSESNASVGMESLVMRAISEDISRGEQTFIPVRDEYNTPIEDLIQKHDENNVTVTVASALTNRPTDVSSAPGITDDDLPDQPDWLNDMYANVDAHDVELHVDKVAQTFFSDNAAVHTDATIAKESRNSEVQSAQSDPEPTQISRDTATSEVSSVQNDEPVRVSQDVLPSAEENDYTIPFLGSHDPSDVDVMLFPSDSVKQVDPPKQEEVRELRFEESAGAPKDEPPVDSEIPVYEGASVTLADALGETGDDEHDGNRIAIPLQGKPEFAQFVADSNPEFLHKRRLVTDPNLLIAMYKTVRETPNSHLFKIHRAADFFTDQQAFNLECMRHSAKTHGDKNYFSNSAKCHDGTVVADSFVDVDKQLEKLKSGTVITDVISRNMSTMLIQGVRRVYHYNSGFYTIVRAPSLLELSRYYDAVRSDAFEYGKVFGSLAYLPMGVRIREAVMDLYETCIVDSNLEKWNVRGTVTKHMSSLDYDGCIHVLVALMFRQGIELDFVCHNGTTGKCRHEEHVKVDIAKFRYQDYYLLREPILRFCMGVAGSYRTPKDLEDFHKNILKDVDHKVQLSDDWDAEMTIPSMEEYINSSRDFLAQMIEEIQITDSYRTTLYQNARFYLSFAPYVNKCTYVRDRGKATEKVLKYVTGVAIRQLIEIMQLRNTIRLPEMVFEFIASKKMTHICVAYSPCPSCGAIPPHAVNRLVPIDLERVFFMLTEEQLPIPEIS